MLTGSAKAGSRRGTGRAIKVALGIVLLAVGAFAGSVTIAPPALAGSYQNDGTYAGTPAAAVAALFAAFPNGGDGLAEGIRTLLLANPELADDVAFLGAGGTAGQQSAAASGMAQAFIILTQRGNTSGASRLVSAAQRSGNAIIQNTVGAAVGTSPVYAGQSTNPVTGRPNCRTPVSPAAPTTCQ